MNFYYIIIVSFLSNLTFSQDLNIKFIEQIIGVDFSKVENFMVEGYGFKKTDLNEENQLEFFKIPNNNIENAIIIKIFNGEKKNNALDISLAKNYSISVIKQNFVENNYLYLGELQNVFWLYEKDNVLVMISQKPNKVGANQIIVSNK